MSVADTPLPVPMIVWLGMNAVVVLAGGVLRWREKASEFRSLAAKPADPDQPKAQPDHSARLLRSLRTTNLVGVFCGAVIVWAWGLLVGLPIFVYGRTPSPDPIRLGFWSFLLLVQAIAWGAWLWLATPAAPRIFAVAVSLVALWAFASILFPTGLTT